MTFETFKSTWDVLISEGSARQRLVDSHPLHLYFGTDDASRAVFVLVTNSRPQVPQLSEAVSVDRGHRSDGSWTVVLTLLQNSLLDTFMGMCVELARRSSGGVTEDSALGLFFETLNQWRLILGRNASRLSMEGLRGLVGELAFGRNCLFPHLSMADMITSWRGPYGAPQDFLLDTGELFEIKAVHSGARAVEISSADQLDPSPSAPLALVLIPVDECPPSAVGAISLPALLLSIRDLLKVGSTERSNLDHRLAAIGLDESDDFYGEQHFQVGLERYFEVTAGFPRVLRQDIPVAVDKLTYRVRIAGLEQFAVHPPDGTFWKPTGGGES